VSPSVLDPPVRENSNLLREIAEGIGAAFEAICATIPRLASHCEDRSETLPRRNTTFGKQHQDIIKLHDNIKIKFEVDTYFFLTHAKDTDHIEEGLGEGLLKA
jgi:hypothetical protein